MSSSTLPQWESIATVAFILSAYCAFTAFLQFFYYTRAPETAKEWKLQPDKLDNVGNDIAKKWWLPVLGAPKKGRHPKLRTWGTINLLNSALVGGFTAECILRGWNKVELPSRVTSWTLSAWIGAQLASHVCQGTLEYWWHRAMHRPFFYEKFHRFHHFYTSTEVGDDMMIHPLEAFLYYWILYSPAYLVRQPLSSFVVYMVVNGLFGVLDHCGINFDFGIYRTLDHDRHHSLVSVNYSFPFPVIDIIHGTYYGRFLGMDFVPWGFSDEDKEKLKRREDGAARANRAKRTEKAG
jgi:lathosterol oxidase